jgi:16S rRNA (adenine1518-N6/adenine1519-N6)-dimethyltransferase
MMEQGGRFGMTADDPASDAQAGDDGVTSRYRKYRRGAASDSCASVPPPGAGGHPGSPSSSQVSIARLREWGITPNRELGQNFLIDDNVLGIIGRIAPLRSGDVVLEVGPGLGVLTRWLSERVAVVHAVEIDRRLEPALDVTLAGVDNVRLLFADAMKLDFAALEPRPSALIANLPYAVATPVVMNALPVCERFCVMVQREIADRLFARPGTKAYGAVSVLVQLSCRRLAVRPVSRRVFSPVPRVDSALVAFERSSDRAAGPGWPALSRTVHAAFAHRRKRLGNAMALAGLAPPPEHLAGLRAEQLEPEQFLELV